MGREGEERGDGSGDVEAGRGKDEVRSEVNEEEGQEKQAGNEAVAWCFCSFSSLEASTLEMVLSITRF